MTGQFQEGVTAAEHALTLPFNDMVRANIYNNMSTNLRDMGRLDDALDACRQAIKLVPTWPIPYHNLQFFLQSKSEASSQELRTAADLYARQFEAPYKPLWPRFADRSADPHRKLTVGFLSPDFNQHAIMYFLEGVLAQLDRKQFVVIALYLQDGEDKVTRRVRRHVDEFHFVAGLTDDALSARIQALKIDILIDLAGHTGATGLGAMARKPAPVQATYLGYPGTTGLTAIDWRFTDPTAEPENAQAEYSEQPWFMPAIFSVYRPWSRFPLYRYQPPYQVQPPPVLSKGFIMFGCCNNLAKLTDLVLKTWGQLLGNVPAARLLIEAKGLEDDRFRKAFEARCAAQGLETERLILLGRDGNQQYLTYHQIDIALDPFPYNGGTTTNDLLWMGVPLVSMVGQRLVSRLGMTFLRNLGHPEWIAENEDDYVRIASQLASDTSALYEWRMTQRSRMEASPLMDEQCFAHHFGMGLRKMWHIWCAKQQFAEDAVLACAAIQAWAEHVWPRQSPQVTVAQGKVLNLQEAQQELQSLTAKALSTAPRDFILKGMILPPPVTHPAWLKVVEWAEFILDAIPNEPLALATLAELEHAHGRTDFATTYLHHAKQSIGRQQAPMSKQI
jgi:tetratricopeptide (TPR) repeat protein